jgi:hypothetical protein
MAKHLSGFQSDLHSDLTPLNLHLLKSMTVYNSIELWTILNEIEMQPSSVHGCKIIIIDGFSCILASSM